MSVLSREINLLLEQDSKLVAAAQDIRVLSALGWPATAAQEFLRSYEQGSPRLPEISYPKVELIAQRQTLVAIARSCDGAHPVGRFLQQTASSYIAAARMLESVGTMAFRELSEALYGSPTRWI